MLGLFVGEDKSVASSKHAVDGTQVSSTAGAPEKGEPSAPTNLLMISNKRHRAFYERAARELMASGHDTIYFSALGDAIPVAIQLANCLSEKQAANITKFETKLVEFNGNSGMSNKAGTRAGGISITMQKHPSFKGTRIVPGYVFFCPPELKEGNSAYPYNPDRWFASVNAACAEDEVFDQQGIGKAFHETLSGAGQPIDSYSNLHNFLLSEALRSNKDENDMEKIRFVGELNAVRDMHNGLKAAFCRVCPKLKEKPTHPDTGAVFVNIIADGHLPHGSEKNCCMLHVVCPKGSDFATREEFLSAVTLTADNLMNAICDFNGYAKRYQGAPKLPRLGVVRIPLISGEERIRHSQTKAEDVAKAILAGLNSGYHFGPASRIQFIDPEGAFKKIWLEECGHSENALQYAEATFISPREKTEKSAASKGRKPV